MNQHRECTFISARRSAASFAAPAVPPSLTCPGCGSPIQAATPPKPGPGGRYGLLACECAEYPMIAGIPIIMSRLGPQAPLPVRRLCRLVTAGEFGRALTTAAEASLTGPLRGFRKTLRGSLAAVFPGRDRRRLPRDRRWLDQPAVEMLKTRFPGRATVDREIQTYFIYRPAHAEHVAAMGLATTIQPDDAPVLDLGAGAGHMAAHLLSRGIPVCGVDRDFFLLLAASRSVAPGGSFVCCDLEEGLPFADASLGAVISVNTVHFLRNKAFLAESLERVLRDGAPVLICALRHSADPGAFRNFSLPPAGYARVFSAFEPRFYATDTVVDCYRRGEPPGDADTRDPGSLLSAPFIELAGQNGSRPSSVVQTFGNWPHASGDLGVNPLYQPARADAGGDTLAFELVVPGEAYARDSRHLLEAMGRTVDIPREVIEAIRAGQRIPAMAPLIDSMALIDLPAGYGPFSASKLA